MCDSINVHNALLWQRQRATLTNVGVQCLQEITGTDVPTNALYDVQIKRIHEYKRQHLNMFSVISKYLDIKKMSKDEKSKASPPFELCFHVPSALCRVISFLQLNVPVTTAFVCSIPDAGLCAYAVLHAILQNHKLIGVGQSKVSPQALTV